MMLSVTMYETGELVGRVYYKHELESYSRITDKMKSTLKRKRNIYEKKK